MSTKGASPAQGVGGFFNIFGIIDMLESAAPWKRGLCVLLFLLLVLCLLMPEIVFQNKMFIVPDVKAPLSFSSVGRKSLEQGIYPLWNPYIFCGMPSYSSLAYAPYVYPVSFVTYILHRYLGMPEMIWLLIHYVIAGIGVYLLMRSLGMSAAVALLSGTVFMMIPNYIAAGANGHGSQVCAIAYMPFALLFARNILQGRRRVAMAAFLAITLGFQMLRGHLQVVYYTYLIIGLLFLFESIYLLRKGKNRTVAVNLAFTAAACIVALGIASILVFPVRDYAEYSIRGGGAGLDYGYATSWSLHPKEMLTFVFPWAFGFGKSTYWGEMPFTDYPNYLGVVTAVFAVIACFIVRDRFRWFLIITAVLATLIGFGRFFPILYDPMFRLFPFFKKFRVPVMILIVQQLALVMLMGMGIEEYLRRAGKGSLPDGLRPKRMKWAAVLGLALLVLLLIGSSGIRSSIIQNPIVQRKVQAGWLDAAARSFLIDLIKTLLFFTLVFAALYVFSLRKTAAGAVLFTFAAIAFFDITLVNRSILHPEATWNHEGYRVIRTRDARDSFLKPDEAVSFLKEDRSYFRIFPVPAAPLGRWSHSVHPFSENQYMISEVFSLGGYHAAKLKNYQDVMDVMFARFNRGVIPVQILNMLNAKYLLSTFPLFEEEVKAYPLVWKRGKTHIYRNEGALPRVFLVDRFRVMPRGDVLAALASPGFDPAGEVILERQPIPAPVSADGANSGITGYRTNEITIQVHAEKPCIMILSEIDYPDWKVSVDGRDAEVLTANYCLRAVALGAGDHTVVFFFSSGIIRFSLIVSIAAFALAVLVPLLHWLIVERKG